MRCTYCTKEADQFCRTCKKPICQTHSYFGACGKRMQATDTDRQIKRDNTLLMVTRPVHPKGD